MCRLNVCWLIEEKVNCIEKRNSKEIEKKKINVVKK